MAMQPAPNSSEVGGPRRLLPMIQRRKFATGRTRLFLSSPASLPVNPNRKSLTKTLSASEAWGVLLTRRDDYLPVNLLYRHRQAGGVNLAGDHSLLIDLCSLYRSLLGRDVTFALTFVPRGRIRQIGTLKDSVQPPFWGGSAFGAKGFGGQFSPLSGGSSRPELLEGPAVALQQPFSFLGGATFQTPIPGVLKQAGSEHRLPFGYHQREPVGDVVRRSNARQAVRLDARNLWLRNAWVAPGQRCVAPLLLLRLS